MALSMGPKPPVVFNDVYQETMDSEAFSVAVRGEEPVARAFSVPC
jgi:hypothetical protein